MSTNQFISVRETAQLLSISENKVMELIESRKLQAYRIADKFLRLKKTEVLNLRNEGAIKQDNINLEYSSKERILDFFYFNDFYLISVLIILILLFIIFFI